MSDPMSGERIAEIHERAGLAVEQLTGDGSSTEFCVQAMPHLLAEVERLRAELEAIRTTRAELAAWQAAGRTTDLEGDVGDHLSDLADWETPNAIAPDWLVRAVVDLLAPIAAERDRLARERDALARADKAGQQWASRRINALEEKIHRLRQVHAPQCGGGCAAVQCECGPDDLVCAECETPAPCATIRALDQEAGR